MLSDEFKKAWPYDFGLVYSVSLTPKDLETSLHVQNKGDKSFDFQVLLHSYLRVKVGSHFPRCIGSLDGVILVVAIQRSVLTNHFASGYFPSPHPEPPIKDIHR